MSMDFALQGLLPLIVFAVVDIFAGMRTAIISALVFSIIEVCWDLHRFGDVDKTTLISLGLILAMGLISIKMKNDRLFKFQPVAMAMVFAVTLGWFQWQGEPLTLQMLPKVATLLPDDRKELIHDPNMLKMMSRLDFLMIGVFIAHGALVAWAALRKTTFYWLIARGVGFYGLMALAFLINILLPRP